MSTSATDMPSLLADRYRPREKLGEGRLAAVYHAEDESLERSVLMHVLRHDLLQQEQLRQRFVDEINASAQRSHPALLEVFDSGEIEGRPFVVTDYVNGRSLYGQGVLRPEDAVLYMRQIAGAVALCQMQDVPHPPISSRNVLLVSEGHVKLVENWQLSPAEISLDLAYYRAPERTEGKPPEPANAVYALGLLLYEFITGQRPVNGQDAPEVARAHLTLRLPSITKAHNRLYLPTLDALLARATARDPASRIANAARFAEELDTTWRNIITETQRLVLPTTPAPAPRTNTGILPRSQPAVAPSHVAPAPAGPISAQAGAPRIEVSARQQPHTPTRSLMRRVLLFVMLLIVAVGVYAGASYTVERVSGVQLPQLPMPQLGLPDINPANIDLDIPEWLSGTEQGETLIVSINEGLNLRNEPGLSTRVVAVVPNGTRVRKLEGPVYVDDVPWVRVRVEGSGRSAEGWMSLNFLNPE